MRATAPTEDEHTIIPKATTPIMAAWDIFVTI
jgi:hypothetical protein